MEIKETKEILAGAKEGFLLGKKVRDIVADGIDASDIPTAFEVIKVQSEKFEIYQAAVEDAYLAKEELQELSKEEILELFMVIIDGINEVEKA